MSVTDKNPASSSQPSQVQDVSLVPYAAVVGRKPLSKLLIPVPSQGLDLSERHVVNVSADPQKPKSSSKPHKQQAVVSEAEQDESGLENKGSPKNSSASSSVSFWKMKAARLKGGKKSPESSTSVSKASSKSVRVSPSLPNCSPPSKASSKSSTFEFEPDPELDALLHRAPDLPGRGSEKVSELPLSSPPVLAPSKPKVIPLVSPASFWSAKSLQMRQQKSSSAGDVSSGTSEVVESRLPGSSPLPAMSPVDPSMGSDSPVVLKPRPMSAPPQRQVDTAFDPNTAVLFDIPEPVPDELFPGGTSPSEFRFSQRNVSCCLGDSSMTVLGLRDIFINDGWDYSRKPLLVVQMPDNLYTSYDNRRLYAAKWAEDLTGSCDVGAEVIPWNTYFKSRPPESNIDIPKLLSQFERLARMKGLVGYVKQPHYSYGDMVIVRMFSKDFLKNDGHLYDASRLAFGYDSYPFVTPMFGDSHEECDQHESHVREIHKQI